MKGKFKQLVADSNTIFLDFDGVVKDSVELKATAF